MGQEYVCLYVTYIEKIKRKVAVLGIIGLGYVGFSVAYIFADTDFPVIGVDLNTENTDNEFRLRNIFDVFDAVDETIVAPLHPRNCKALQRINYTLAQKICLLESVGYLDMIQLFQNVRLILTDSGGLQKEAYWLQVSCITLRGETELANDWNRLVGADAPHIIAAVSSFTPPSNQPILSSMAMDKRYNKL